MSNPDILIREELLKSVLSGQKKTTCRFGKRDYKLEETILQSNSSNNFALINITKLDYITVKDLNEEIAYLDGFKTKSEFISVLEDIYGKLKDNDIITVVYFDLIK